MESKSRYSFCEGIFAGPCSPWHIRQVPEGAELKYGGGIQTGGLCGWPHANEGWDLQVKITEHHLGHTCKRCAELYRKAQEPK